MNDEEYHNAKIITFGLGGAGCNLVNKLTNRGIKSATTVALNTDAKHLNMINAHKKILIGKEITRGLGAGGFPEIGAKCAEASQREINDAIKDHDLVFLCGGLGGGTGGGALPVVAKYAKEQGALVVAFVTYPFLLERSRKQKADYGLEQLVKNTDTTIVVENERLLSYAPNLPIEKAFDLIDNIVYNAVRGISDTISLPSMINIDFADLRTVMRSGGTATINIGFGSGPDRVERVIRSVRDHPLLDVSTENAKSALVHVYGPESLTISDVTKIVEGVTVDLDPRANVIMGARLTNEAPADSVEVMSVITGVTPRFGSSNKSSYTDANFISGLESIL
jgi:cell division protein FtsZ